MGLNQYSELLNYIKQLGDADIFVNTITQGEDIDLNKGNIFPLLNVDIISASFTNGQTVIFNIEISCLDIRDINKEVVADKFYLNDNLIDNMNETLATLNRLWLIMYRDFSDNNITASENPQFEAIKFEDKNLLDGWTLLFDIEVPNTTISLC